MLDDSRLTFSSSRDPTPRPLGPLVPRIAACFSLAAGLLFGQSAPIEASGCRFEQGFEAFRELTGDLVGACVEDERHDPLSGDGLQRTTKGLLVWRKADNRVAFTDGARTWVEGPSGVQERASGARFPWEAVPAAAGPIPAAATVANWLGRLNVLRGLAGLPGLVEDPALDAAAAAHARYMGETGIVAHAEDPASPAYTAAGDAAAAASELIAFSRVASDTDAVDGLAEGPFHAFGLLDPSLTTAGFASYRGRGTAIGSAFDLLPGAGRGAARPTGSGPVMWPGDGSRVPLSAAAPDERPNPLAPCGYTQPAGLPLIFELGEGEGATRVGTHALLRDGAPVDHCVYDASSYTNPDPADQAKGRAILAAYAAVVIIPRRPLTPGSTYTAHLVVNGEPYSWSFRVVPG